MDVAITAYLLIAVTPVLAGVVTAMLMDIHFGTAFFSAAGGGDPVLFQHVFWFFGHPEVYIISAGLRHVGDPTLARKKLFGYDSMVYATLLSHSCPLSPGRTMFMACQSQVSSTSCMPPCSLPS